MLDIRVIGDEIYYAGVSVAKLNTPDSTPHSILQKFKEILDEWPKVSYNEEK